MNFFHTHISPKAIEFVVETLQSGFVSEGKRVRQFEQELSQKFGLVRPVTVNSGTSALHLALEIAGIGSGDEVILPAQTFVASGLVILMCGANPVFADIQINTGNLDPASVREKITPRTKAIMPVHWAGCPCDMDEINQIADEHGLVVVEDAAHAFGAIYKERPVGSLSRFTAFSFQAIKHLTTGDGGALCCSNEDDYEEAMRRRWFGIDRERHKPSMLGEREYDLELMGFKYHLNDLGAAVGLGNLLDISGNLTRHREIAAIYESELRNLAGLTLLNYPADRESSRWVFTMLVERREDFVRALNGREVPVSVVHQRIDRNYILGGLRQDLTNQHYFDEHQIALPIHVALTDDDIVRIVSAIRAGW